MRTLMNRIRERFEMYDTIEIICFLVLCFCTAFLVICIVCICTGNVPTHTNNSSVVTTNMMTTLRTLSIIH